MSEATWEEINTLQMVADYENSTGLDVVYAKGGSWYIGRYGNPMEASFSGESFSSLITHIKDWTTKSESDLDSCSVKTLKLDPGSILVIKYPGVLSDDQEIQLKKQIESRFERADIDGCSVLVLQNGLEIDSIIKTR